MLAKTSYTPHTEHTDETLPNYPSLNPTTMSNMSVLKKAVLVVSFSKTDCTKEADGSYPDAIYGTIRLNGTDASATSVKFYRIEDQIELVAPTKPNRFEAYCEELDADDDLSFTTAVRQPDLLYYYTIFRGNMSLVAGSESVPYGLDFCKMATHYRTSYSIADYEIGYAQPSTVLPVILTPEIKSFVALNIRNALLLKCDQFSSRDVPFSFTYWTSLTSSELDSHMTKNIIELRDEIELKKKRESLLEQRAFEKRRAESRAQRSGL